MIAQEALVLVAVRSEQVFVLLDAVHGLQPYIRDDPDVLDGASGGRVIASDREF